MTLKADEATLIALDFMRRAGHSYLSAISAKEIDDKWVITIQTINLLLEVIVDKNDSSIVEYRPIKPER